MLIRSLRANHLKNPLGFKMDAPLLTWTLEGSAGDAPKTARVQVALSSAFDAPLVDTGAREDLSPLGFTPEMTLAPRTRYYWRVEATSEKGETAVSKTAWFETAKQDEPWQAEWIEAPFDRQIHPLFAKPFTLREAPVRARAYVTGLGVYELTVNGERVSDEVLAPFYNDYDNWIQYQTYDITPLLRAGENRFDAMLGNGWYKGRFGWVENMCELFGDRMKLLAEIRCEFADGSELVLGTDGTWLCHASPVVESSIYDGEVYDARLELAPGSLEGFVNAKASETPAGALTARLSPPVRICERRKPAQAAAYARRRKCNRFRPGYDRLGRVRLRSARGREGLSAIRRAAAARQLLSRQPAHRQRGIHLHFGGQARARAAALHLLRFPVYEGGRNGRGSRQDSPPASSTLICPSSAKSKPPTRR